MDNLKNDSGLSLFGKIKKNFSWIAILILVIIIGVYVIRVKTIKKRFDKEKQEIVQKYEIKLDSIDEKRLELTAKVFSWAVRSEMTRQNMEEVNVFFLNFVKESDITKLQLITPAKNMITISTDKKEEGTVVTDRKIIKSANIVTDNDSVNYKIIVPVMGLNKKLGTVVLFVKRHYLSEAK